MNACRFVRTITKKGQGVLYAYGVALKRKGKGRTFNRGQKRPEVRELPQKFE